MDGAGGMDSASTALDGVMRRALPGGWGGAAGAACALGGCVSGGLRSLSTCQCGALGGLTGRRYACATHAGVPLRRFARGVLAVSAPALGTEVVEWLLRDVVANMARVQVPPCCQHHLFLGTWMLVAKFWELSSIVPALRSSLFEHVECVAGICQAVLLDIEVAVAGLYGFRVVWDCTQVRGGSALGGGGKRQRTQK